MTKVEGSIQVLKDPKPAGSMTMSEKYLSERLDGDFQGENQPILDGQYCPEAKDSCSNTHKRRVSKGLTPSKYTITLTIIWSSLIFLFYQYKIRPEFESFPSCAWKHIEPYTPLLDVKPISRDEFLERQKVLATAINEAGVDAFIAEPSASSTYYANISSAFELSERPFLIILDKNAQFSYLVPKFEAGRIAGLDMVYESKKVIEWHEEESPYEALKKATGYKKIMVDEHVRFMIAAGLEKGMYFHNPRVYVLDALACKVSNLFTVSCSLRTY